MNNELNHIQLRVLQDRFAPFLSAIDMQPGYSQWGEEAIIKAILGRIGAENRWCCEIGAGDGIFLSNTKALIDAGWNAVFAEVDEEKYQAILRLYELRERMDGEVTVQLMSSAQNGYIWAFQAQVKHAGHTSICLLLTASGAPKNLDVLSIDVDGQDYHLLNSLLQFSPRIIVCEYDPSVTDGFIPEINGPGQAGLQAICAVGAAKCYTPVCATHNNVIFVQNKLAGFLVDEATRKQVFASGKWQDVVAGGKIECNETEMGLVAMGLRFSERTVPAILPGQALQVFAAGRWQILREGVTIEVFDEEEAEKAKNGLLPQRIIEGEVKEVRTIMALSTPRIGFLDSSDCLADAARAVKANRIRGYGISWAMALTRAIEACLNWHDPISGEPADFIVTGDYDSYCRPQDLQQMVQILGRHPEIDILVPMQIKRGTPNSKPELLASWEGGRNLNSPLVPIDSGHFGFTLFRREVFEKLPKPWFLDVPDNDGGWNEGYLFADMYFWKKAKDLGLKVYLSTDVVVGHGEEFVSWPVIKDGKVGKYVQPVNSWLDGEKRPEHVGVLPSIKWPETWPGLRRLR